MYCMGLCCLVITLENMKENAAMLVYREIVVIL